jgi:hypothetical protein
VTAILAKDQAWLNARAGVHGGLPRQRQHRGINVPPCLLDESTPASGGERSHPTACCSSPPTTPPCTARAGALLRHSRRRRPARRGVPQSLTAPTRRPSRRPVAAGHGGVGQAWPARLYGAAGQALANLGFP